MKYLRVALYMGLAKAARWMRLDKSVVWELEDQATLRAFDCSLDFEPVNVTTVPPKRPSPRGWQCPHMNITYGGAITSLTAPSAYCGCQMQPMSTTGVG